MKRILIPFLAAFVLGLTGAAGALVLKNKGAPPVAAADSTAADSSGADSVQHAAKDSGAGQQDTSGAAQAVQTLADSGLVQRPDGLPATDAPAAAGHDIHAPPSKAGVKGVPAVPTANAAPAEMRLGEAVQAGNVRNAAGTPAASPAAARPTPVPAAPSASEKRLAKVFAAMPPKDAAKVLDQMSDADVAAILANLTDKQTAAVLASFPPKRAAAITRATLAGSAP